MLGCLEKKNTGSSSAREGCQDVKASHAPEVALDLDLPPDLLLDLGRHKLVLIHALESDDVVGCDLCPSQVDSTELALSERATDLELRQRPILVRSKTA
jgi:hypothetical protein